MKTLTAADTRRILDALEEIETLTGLLRHSHFTVPYAPVSGAIGATHAIRQTILRVALADVEVETAREVEAV